MVWVKTETCVIRQVSQLEDRRPNDQHCDDRRPHDNHQAVKRFSTLLFGGPLIGWDEVSKDLDPGHHGQNTGITAKGKPGETGEKAWSWKSGKRRPSRKMVAMIIPQSSSSTPAVAGPNAREAVFGPPVDQPAGEHAQHDGHHCPVAARQRTLRSGPADGRQ